MARGKAGRSAVRDYIGTSGRSGVGKNSSGGSAGKANYAGSDAGPNYTGTGKPSRHLTGGRMGDLGNHVDTLHMKFPGVKTQALSGRVVRKVKGATHDNLDRSTPPGVFEGSMPRPQVSRK